MPDTSVRSAWFRNLAIDLVDIDPGIVAVGKVPPMHEYKVGLSLERSNVLGLVLWRHGRRVGIGVHNVRGLGFGGDEVGSTLAQNGLAAFALCSRNRWMDEDVV